MSRSQKPSQDLTRRNLKIYEAGKDPKSISKNYILSIIEVNTGQLQSLGEGMMYTIYNP